MAIRLDEVVDAITGVLDIGVITSMMRGARSIRGGGAMRQAGAVGQTTVPGPTSNALGFGKVDESRFGRAVFLLNDEDFGNLLELFVGMQKHQVKQLRISFSAVPDSFVSPEAGGTKKGDQSPKTQPISRDVEVLKGIARSVRNAKVGVDGTIKLMLLSGMITETTVAHDAKLKFCTFFGMDPTKIHTLKEFDEYATAKIAKLPRIPHAKAKGPNHGFFGWLRNWFSGY